MLSFLVSRQTRDLGIRFALGAQRRDVFWLVIGKARRCASPGRARRRRRHGPRAMAVQRAVRISPTDPATYVAVAVVVSLVTLVACYVPTRRAMGVDPLIVLREQ